MVGVRCSLSDANCTTSAQDVGDDSFMQRAPRRPPYNHHFTLEDVGWLSLLYSNYVERLYLARIMLAEEV